MSDGTPGPAGVTSYTVSITSQFLCFSLAEPIVLYVIGNTGVAAFTPVFPSYFPSPGNPITVHVDPTTGTATLILEVFTAEVGPQGLDVKAVWTREGIERVVNVIPPAKATATPTPLPGQPTSTPTSTSTPTPTATIPPPVTPTGTTTTTATALQTPSAPTATATPTPALFVRACFSPSPVALGGTATLYGLTLPGASCTASVVYNTGFVPSDFTGSAETAANDGTVRWSFTVSTGPTISGTGGSGSITCTFGTQTLTRTITFTLPSTPTPTPTRTPG